LVCACSPAPNFHLVYADVSTADFLSIGKNTVRGLSQPSRG
jgi:hypothetical protein